MSFVARLAFLPLLVVLGAAGPSERVLKHPGGGPALVVPAGSPVLRCERLTTTVDGTPVLLSEHIFPGHRTEFVVDLPQAAPSIVPSGLRLVE